MNKTQMNKKKVSQMTNFPSYYEININIFHILSFFKERKTVDW